MRDQGSYVDQDHITSQRHAFENVIQNQVLNVNQDHIQPRQALEDSHFKMLELNLKTGPNM